MKKLYVYSENDFINQMGKNGWVDSIPENVAVISIDNHSNPYHYFPMSNHQILNIEFDDISYYTDGCMAGLDDEQAQKMVDFIINNKECDFYLHCNAGRSRSQGVCRFILDCIEGEWETRKENPCNTPNYHVVVALKRAFRRYFENNETNI